MKKLIGVFLVLFVIGFASTALAQNVTMTTAQKVQLSAVAVDAAGATVPMPQTAVTVTWSSQCASCTFTGGAYDATAKAWTVWYNAGTELGTFTVTLVVTYSSGQKFTATIPVTINEVVVIPASVKIVPGTPIAK